MVAESNSPSVDPHIVGNAFVQKYYNHLYESPAQVHKFYLEDSVLGRPGPDGDMVSVKSLKAINDQIMSFDYNNSKIQILTADSQASYKDGVVTLVTGLITGKDGQGMGFSQSFFLVPKKGSYFVLNDVFRYVSDELSKSDANDKEFEESPQVTKPAAAVSDPAKEAVEPVTEAAEQVNVLSQPAAEQIKETSAKERENVTANGDSKVLEKKLANGNSNGHEAAEAKPQQEASKKSFAVIVQSLAQNGSSFHAKASPAKPKPVEKSSPLPEPKAPMPVPEDAAPAKTSERPAEGGSIFVANLPMDATPEQLQETFKHFGAIKQDGIQVRSYKLKGNCFGFVAFESAEAIKDVLKAHRDSPIRIGNRRVSIEEKRANDGDGRSYGRNGGYRNENGYRNDGYRPRRHINGGRGYGRNGYERRGESRDGDIAANAKAFQNGLARATREHAHPRH